MSALDPTAAAMLAAAQAADNAILETILDLGAAPALQLQMNVGDILPALVLKPQNGYDRIQIAGQTVTAQLPPDVHPGETLSLQVTAFNGNQIVVRNLGVADSQDAPAQNAPQQNAPQQQNPPVAPSAAVFVAASVRQTAPGTAQAPQTPQAQALQAAAPKSGDSILAAKIAAAQTPRAATPAAIAKPVVPASANPAAAPAAPFVRATLSQAATVAAVVRTTSDVLRGVRLPDNAFTRTVAAVAKQAPQRLAPVVARLDQVLARVANDPRASTLRTLLAFTGRMNLANAETLPTQIASYVSHVVQGAETKVVQLLRALVQAQAEIASQEPQTPVVQAQSERTHLVDGSPAIVNGNVAQQLGAVEHDLKTLVLSLLNDPPQGRVPALAQALNETLVTITGTQLNVLNANVQQPAAITLPLPAFFYEGGKPTYLRIEREGAGAGAPMDADNFSVAFVLDTANLGTVAINVQTASRNVKVDVKTEHSRAASAFTDTLGSLKDRLETLRYRVSSATAKTAEAQTVRATEVTATPQAPKAKRTDATLDLQA